MAITVIGCIFCLMHLRVAALLLTLVVLPPTTVFFALTGNAVFIAIAANLLFVSLAVVFVLCSHYRDFTNLIEAKKELVAKNAQTQRLNDLNYRLAHFNQLTGLPKRRQFFAELSARIVRARPTGQRLAIALIDLAGFRMVNHVHGHAMGDRVLVEAGRRLRQLRCASCFVARLGADEFGVIIEEADSDEALRAFGDMICEAMREPFTLSGASIQLAASVGLAAFPDAADNAQRLFERADYALYYAKQNRRGAAVLFSKEHESEIYDLSLIHQELRRADLDRELSLVFQPIVDMDTQRTVCLEALARWNSPQLGTVPPSVFITAAERLGLVNRLTEVLLAKALAAGRAWPADIFLAFNLSSHDITSPDAIERILEITRASGVDPRRISFEITETAAMRDFDQACTALHALKELGARIALDDFGSGYSSLGHVHRLPLDEIKIDRSFIVDIENNLAARDVVRTVIDLCRNLNLLCVVEGAETRAQALILRSLGCRTMQGYLFSRPLSERDLGDFLAREGEAQGQVDALPDNVLQLLDPVAAGR
jgi:diguanylate cyclase (GGDEF)-like protein